MYQGVRIVCFLKNLTCFVFLKHLFWDLPFCLITDDIAEPLLLLLLLHYWWWCPNPNFWGLRYQWCQRLTSEFGGGEERVERATRSWSDLSSHRNNSSSQRLGATNDPTLLPCSKFCLEIHKLARWIEGEELCCLENKSWGNHSSRFP